MSKFKFTSEMFFPEYHLFTSEGAANKAQAALDKHLESLTKVYGYLDDPNKRWVSREYRIPSDTHQALLFSIEPIEKKKCSHEVIFDSDIGYVCVHCEKTLKPIGGWEVAE